MCAYCLDNVSELEYNDLRVLGPRHGDSLRTPGTIGSCSSVIILMIDLCFSDVKLSAVDHHNVFALGNSLSVSEAAADAKPGCYQPLSLFTFCIDFAGYLCVHALLFACGRASVRPPPSFPFVGRGWGCFLRGFPGCCCCCICCFSRFFFFFSRLSPASCLLLVLFSLSLSPSFSLVVHLFVSLSVCLPVYLSVSVPVCICVCVAVHMPVHLSVRLLVGRPVCLLVHLSVSLLVSLSVRLPVHLSVCFLLSLSFSLSAHMPVSLSVYLPVYPSVLPVACVCVIESCRLCISVSVRLPVCPSVGQSLSISMSLSVRLSVCLRFSES